jgi:hypothetical protein
VSGPHTAVELPDRAERIEALRAVIGRPAPSAAIIPERLWTIFEEHYDRVVSPIIDRSWPRSEADENRRRFLRKGQFIGGRYLSISYVPVALGVASPLRVLPFAAPLERLVLGPALRVGEPLIVRTTAALVPAFIAAAPIDLRVTALLAGLCTAYDQSFDDWPPGFDPVERHEHLERLWRRPEGAPGGPEPGSVALTRGLLVEIKASLDPGRYDELAQLGCNASEAEMRLVLDLPDPEMLSHRRVAAVSTIDAMIIQSGSVAPIVRDWLHDLAVFTQLVDDWVDVETDVELRETPVLTGSIGLSDLDSRWARLLGGLAAMLRSCGIHERRTAELVEDGVRYVIWSGLEGMEHRIAD